MPYEDPAPVILKVRALASQVPLQKVAHVLQLCMMLHTHLMDAGLDVVLRLSGGRSVFWQMSRERPPCPQTCGKRPAVQICA